MAFVSGGPVVLPPAVLADQPDMEGTGVACVAPFEIDRYEVTNAQYLAFWNALPAEDRRRLSFQVNHYPFGWTKTGAPFPPDVADCPVLGVPLPGALAYAKAHGKRLPTPYEWCLAAFGPKGEQPMPEWAQRYVSERKRVWGRVRELHIEYLRANPEVRQPPGAFHGSSTEVPWILKHSLHNYATAWSKQVVENQTGPLWEMWRDPFYILPVGARDYDVSPFGAADMILNAYELVASYPGPPARGADRYMEIVWEKTKLFRDDPWTPRRMDLLRDEMRLPPLSRLYRRALFGPSMEDIVLWSNLSEAAEMLFALAGWRLRIGSGREDTMSTWTQWANPYKQFGYPAGFSLWREMPRHYRNEMGRPVPFNDPDAHVRPGVSLFYALPVGFRCAR